VVGRSFIRDGSCFGVFSVIRKLFRFLNHPTGDLDLDSLSGSPGGSRFIGNEDAFTMLCGSAGIGGTSSLEDPIIDVTKDGVDVDGRGDLSAGFRGSFPRTGELGVVDVPRMADNEGMWRSMVFPSVGVLDVGFPTEIMCGEGARSVLWWVDGGTGCCRMIVGLSEWMGVEGSSKGLVGCESCTPMPPGLT
jgi:hypothetical protein